MNYEKATVLDGEPGRENNISRESLGIARDAFVLIYPAELSSRKSQPVLILCGDGVDLERCKTLARELKPDQRVLFPGQVERMATWYTLANAAVSASRSEGLPFNVMEAMHCGLPVVASRVKGHTDLIEDRATGLLYECSDEKQCAERVQELRASPELRVRMGTGQSRA